MQQEYSLPLSRFSASDSGMARFVTTVAVLCTVLIYVIAETRGSTNLLKIGSYNLCAEDAAVIPLVVALLSRVDVGRLVLSRILLCLVLLLALFNLLVGISYNAFSALFEFRNKIVFLLFLGIMFARWGTLRPLEYLGFPLVIASIAFLFLFLIRQISGPLTFVDPNSTGAIYVDFLEGRVIGAETTVFLGAAAAFFISEGSRNSSNGFRRLAYWALAGICLVVVLMSRQRTASTGVIVGLSAFFLVHPTLLGVKRTPRVLAVGFLGILFIALVATNDLLDVVPDEYRDSLLKRDTLNSRFEMWTAALAEFSRSGFSWQMFGRPAGVPLVLQLEIGEWRYSVHSAYVGVLMQYGIVGALMWATLLLAALFAAFRRRHIPQMFDLEPSIAACWLIMYLIYGFSYEWGNGAAVFIGMAMMPLIRSNDIAATSAGRSNLEPMKLAQ